MVKKIWLSLLLSAAITVPVFVGSTALEVFAANTSQNVLPAYSDQQTGELSLTSSLSKEIVQLGEQITVNAQAAEGNGKKRYKFSYKNSSNDWITVQDYSDKSTAVFDFQETGKYRIIVGVRDEDNTYKENLYDVVVKNETGRELTVTSQISAQKTAPNTVINVTADADGGTQPYRYKFSYKNSKGDWITVQDYSAKNTASFRFSEVGYYTVIIGVRDYDNHYSENLYEVAVQSDTKKKLEVSSTISSRSINAGGSIKINARAAGGVAPYKYKFSYKTGDNEWIVVRDYSVSNTAVLRFPESGYYNVIVGVRDSDNHYSENLYSVVVKDNTNKELKVTSSIDSTEKYINDPISVSAKASGGYGPYRYKFSYKDSSGNWITVQDYSAKSKAQIKFTKSGYYTVIVGVRDYNNRYTENLYVVKIKRDTGKNIAVNASANKTAAAEGETFKVTASASGGTEPYQYQYSYLSENGKWTVAKDFSANSSADIKINAKGVYTLKVTAMDGNNKTVSKSFSMNIYSKTASRTISKTILMANPRWATVTLKEVPQGSGVNIIKQSDRWFLVNYNGTVGWLYNLALGSYSNYSSVTVDTLPAVADDIIFNRGRSVYSLYKYVTGMGYRSMEKDTVENMCVYIIKYRRGACYQRAALLYYLYKRAGFDVIRVDDGIDNYTGGGPHNWCIIKTADGYRHIDPTGVIGLPEFYLVKDSAIAPYFSWDRKKYPECK